MNTKLPFWIFIGSLAVITAGILLYLLAPSENSTQIPPQTRPQPGVTLPIGGSVTPVPVSPTPTPTARMMTITTLQGDFVVVPDFVHNGVTIPDEVNAGRYLLAGNLGYCLSDPERCQAAPASNYEIYYNSQSQSFTITLTKEPIAEARLAAERFLLATLGLSSQKLCTLDYYLGVIYTTNPTYTGKNLGFSFCPGAVPLPQ